MRKTILADLLVGMTSSATPGEAPEYFLRAIETATEGEVETACQIVERYDGARIAKTVTTAVLRRVWIPAVLAPYFPTKKSTP